MENAASSRIKKEIQLKTFGVCTGGGEPASRAQRPPRALRRVVGAAAYREQAREDEGAALVEHHHERHVAHLEGTHTHAHAHARTHTRMHAEKWPTATFCDKNTKASDKKQSDGRN